MMPNQRETQNCGFLKVMVIAGFLLGTSTARSAADRFYWEGDNNDNWQNPANWEQEPGSGDVPENSNDEVTFDPLATLTDVDVNNNTYDIGLLTIHTVPFHFFDGTLRLHNDLLLQNHSDTLFDATLTIEQAESRIWEIWDSHLTFDGLLAGSGNIYLDGNGTVTFNSANPYTGELTIIFPQVILGDPNALQNCTVKIAASPNRLNVNGLDAVLGGLSGNGDFNMGATTMRVGRNDASTLFSGDISGGGSIIKQGSGALTLSGNLDGLDTLTSTSGDMNIHGGGNIQRLLVQAGSTHIRNAALNLASGITNTLFVSGNAVVRIENGAAVTVSGTGASYRTVLTHNALLSVEDAGSSLTTPRLDIGPSGAGSAEVIAQLEGTIDAGRIRVGDLAGDDGAAGTLSILSGGTVMADQIVLSRRGAIDIAGGTLATDTLVDGDTEPHQISISDPVSGAALTIGTNDGSSIVDALIEDGSLGQGSIRKVGNGSLQLIHANTFSGGVTIDGGTLQLGEEPITGFGVGVGDVIVNAGGTLAGAGNAPAVIANAGGAVAPGAPDAPIGVIFSSELTVHAGANVDIDLAGVSENDHDLLAVENGPITLNGGTLELSYSGGFVASPGDVFVLIGADEITGTFDSVVYPDAQTWFINYDSHIVVVGVCADADSDGVCDVNDICPGGDDNLDSDADGVPDFCDACPNRIAGDVSGDGMISIDDVPSFTAVLLNPDAATPDDFCAADINEDTAVNGLDAQAMVNLILTP